MRLIKPGLAVLGAALLLGCDLGCRDHGLCVPEPWLPASDLLPLQRGIYVAAGSACEAASDVDTLSYWGGRNGINSTKASCTIRGLSRRGPAYVLDRRCAPITGGGAFDERVELTLLDRSSFVFRGDAGLGLGEKTYRYCGMRREI